jgi:hypothetical protein
MLGPQQMTKTTARVLLAGFCTGLLCGLGVLIYVMVLMDQFRGALRQTVVAMSDPERLAAFERAVQEEHPNHRPDSCYNRDGGADSVGDGSWTDQGCPADRLRRCSRCPRSGESAARTKRPPIKF